MPLFSDSAYQVFNNLGYNVVRRPTGGLAAGDVLVRDDVLERLDTLANVAQLDAPMAPALPPAPVVSLDGQLTSPAHITTALGDLRMWLRALSGGTTPTDPAPAFASARFLQFRVDAPMTVRLPPYTLAASIDKARVAPTSPLSRYLQDRTVDLYVVSEILQTDRVTVQALDVGSSPVPIDVPALADALGSNLKVSTSSAGPSWVTCQGRAPVTFAFRVMRVRRSKSGKLSNDHDVRASSGSAASREESVLFAPGTLVAVS
jgi:hypothetical protein